MTHTHSSAVVLLVSRCGSFQFGLIWHSTKNSFIGEKVLGNGTCCLKIRRALEIFIAISLYRSWCNRFVFWLLLYYALEDSVSLFVELEIIETWFNDSVQLNCFCLVILLARTNLFLVKRLLTLSQKVNHSATTQKCRALEAGTKVCKNVNNFRNSPSSPI